mgnify:CR=1 FL=1
MLLKITLVAEILAVVICIHRVYGRKIEFDILTIALILSLLAILEFINIYQLENINTIVIYVLLFIYCVWKFKESIFKTVINILLFIIVLTIIQFISILALGTFIPGREEIQTVICNTIVLLISIWILPKFQLNKVSEAILKRRKLTILLLIFMFLVIFVMLLQGKLLKEVYIEVFIFAIPAIIFLLVLLVKWNLTQTRAEELEEKLKITESSKKEYNQLLVNVRLRQHELRNHLSAIFSTHYTYKTYEKLVKAQQEYCNRISRENKYNSLLLIGDNVLAGFLYGKFQEMEADGINVNYKVGVQIKNCSVPVYHLIEMLGILLDNALEAVKDTTWDRTVYFILAEKENMYQFSVQNRTQYISYSDIERLFQLGWSEKGAGRGIGLYHVKCLCDEYNCDIGCKNIEMNEENWIEFDLGVHKADSI